MRVALTSDTHSGASRETHKILSRFFESMEEDKEWDVLILAGDLGIATFDHFLTLLNMVKVHIKRPVVAVRGNHDLWDKRKYNLQATIKYGSEKFAEYGIHHLESGPYIKDGVAFVGWDGWYNMFIRGRNEWNFIPHYTAGLHTHDFLKNREDKEFQRVLDELEQHKDKKRVVVTHMPPFKESQVWDPLWDEHAGNPRFISFLEGNADVLCYGHTHLAHEEVIKGIRVYNSGSDYDEPNYIKFEV